MSHWSWGAIIKAFPDSAVVRVDYFYHEGSLKFSPQGVELVTSLGVNVIAADYGVILEFADEDEAYSLVRYCMMRGIKAALYVEEHMIESTNGLLHCLKMTEEDIERFRRRGGYLAGKAEKVKELEESWAENHLRL